MLPRRHRDGRSPGYLPLRIHYAAALRIRGSSASSDRPRASLACRAEMDFCSFSKVLPSRNLAFLLNRTGLPHEPVARRIIHDGGDIHSAEGVFLEHDRNPITLGKG